MPKLTLNRRSARQHREGAPCALRGGAAGLLLLACDATTDSQGEAPSRIEQKSNLRPATVQQEQQKWDQPGTPQTVHASPETAVDERPSVDENMGRSFQGRLVMRVHTPSGERTLRYLTRGNRARLQVDAAAGAAAGGSNDTGGPAMNYDALIWDQSISTLNHRQKTYRTLPLDDVKPRAENAGDVDVRKTGDRSSLAGVTCEHYEITDGPTRVSTCVSALPGSFNVDKFETSSGVDVPPWAEQLLDDEMLPLRAKAVDASGRELYSLELVEYSPGPVDEALLALPATYRAEGAPHANEDRKR